MAFHTGQTVHAEILRGKENVEARAGISSTWEKISIIATYSPIPLSHDDRSTVSLLGYGYYLKERTFTFHDGRSVIRSPSDGACISHTSPWSQPFPE